jgi:hypothetical protein
MALPFQKISSLISIHTSQLFPNIYLLIEVMEPPFQQPPLFLISLMMEKTQMQEFMFLVEITLISYLLLTKMIIPHS